MYQSNNNTTCKPSSKPTYKQLMKTLTQPNSQNKENSSKNTILDIGGGNFKKLDKI